MGCFRIGGDRFSARRAEASGAVMDEIGVGVDLFEARGRLNSETGDLAGLSRNRDDASELHPDLAL